MDHKHKEKSYSPSFLIDIYSDWNRLSQEQLSSDKPDKANKYDESRLVNLGLPTLEDRGRRGDLSNEFSTHKNFFFH